MTDALPAVPDEAVAYLLTYHEGDGWQARAVQVNTFALELYGRSAIRLAPPSRPDNERRNSGQGTPGYDPALMAKARERIDALCIAEQVSHDESIRHRAANILAGFWTVGLIHGVAPQKWSSYANLLVGSLDAALDVDAQAGHEPGGWSLGKL